MRAADTYRNCCSDTNSNRAFHGCYNDSRRIPVPHTAAKHSHFPTQPKNSRMKENRHMVQFPKQTRTCKSSLYSALEPPPPETFQRVNIQFETGATMCICAAIRAPFPSKQQSHCFLRWPFKLMQHIKMSQLTCKKALIIRPTCWHKMEKSKHSVQKKMLA